MTKTKKEQRVYIIDTTFISIDDIRKTNDEIGFVNLFDGKKRTDKIFMEISEKQGNVYSLGGFTKAFNGGEINPHSDIIRFIEV